MTETPARIDDLFRELAPHVLGALVRRYGHFDEAEDAVQEALVAASVQWPEHGLPDDPRAWLIRVASRRLTDLLRSTGARIRREDAYATTPGGGPVDDEDDTLTLLFLCCHESISAPSQIALTLRAVGGLTTGEIANAFLVPEATMGQRISRAKARIREVGANFALPPEPERAERLAAVLHVLYLVFNEGYSASEGAELQRKELTSEAIRLTRMVHARLPDDGEVAGLLALMLLIDARSAARTGPHGELIALSDQDRSRWDRTLIAEGVALVTDAMARAPLGPYQVQAAIAALHDEAPTAAATDWPQILALYGVLEQMGDNPMVRLNHAVAAAMVHGAPAGLALLRSLDDDARVAEHHRVDAVRAHLLEMAGDRAGAIAKYHDAARKATSVPEQRYLRSRADALAADAG